MELQDFGRKKFTLSMPLYFLFPPPPSSSLQILHHTRVRVMHQYFKDKYRNCINSSSTFSFNTHPKEMCSWHIQRYFSLRDSAANYLMTKYLKCLAFNKYVSLITQEIQKKAFKRIPFNWICRWRYKEFF